MDYERSLYDTKYRCNKCGIAYPLFLVLLWTGNQHPFLSKAILNSIQFLAYFFHEDCL